MKDYMTEIEQNDEDVDETKGYPKDPIKALKLIHKMVTEFNTSQDEVEVGFLLDELEEITQRALKE